MLDQFDVITDSAKTIARAFVEARHRVKILQDFPGPHPQSFRDAYEIQDSALALDGRAVGGWKVGLVKPPLCDDLGIDRLSGPIFADMIASAHPNQITDMPIFAEGFAAAEAELMFRIARPALGDVRNFDDAQTLGLIDRVHVGMEIASSPFPGINSFGPFVTVADFGNNCGLLIGPELPDWRTRDLSAVHARLTIDGIEQGASDMSLLPRGPLGSVRFLSANLMERGLSGNEPYWVSAGAMTGVHAIGRDSIAEAWFDDSLVVRCRTTGIAPRSA